MVAKRKISKSARKHLVEIKEAGMGQVHVLPTSADIKVGKKKVPASGLNKQQSAGKVLGDTIIKHIGQHDTNLFGDLTRLIAANNYDFHSACYGVVSMARDDARTQIKADGEAQLTAAKDSLESAAYRKTAKEIERRTRARLNNSSVKFSMLVKVMQQIGRRYATEKPVTVDFGQCKSFADMLTVARLAEAPKSAKKLPPLTETGFKAWAKKMSRIVDVENYEKDDEKSQAQIGRAESFIKDVVLWYLKLSEQVSGLRPLGELIPVSKPAKLRKAA